MWIDPKQDGSGQQADPMDAGTPGADGALAMGAIRNLLATGSFDIPLLRQWTNAPLLVDTEAGLLRADEFGKRARSACCARRAGELLPCAMSDLGLTIRSSL
ncbi:MAG: hypothetical protein R3E52_03265 [Burkholderiaceae bacterium]